MTSELEQAKAEAAAARADLVATADQLQRRLNPTTLADIAMEGAKRKGSAIAADTVLAVRKHPITLGAAVAGISAFLGFNLFRRFFKPSDEHGD